MWTIVVQILVGLIVAGIIAVISFVVGKGRNALNSRKRWLNKILAPSGISKSRPEIVLCSSLIGKTRDSHGQVAASRLEYMHFQDAACFGYINGLLGLLKINPSTQFVDTQNKCANIFCVGGPPVNDASKRAFELVKDKIAFELTRLPLRIINKVAEKEFVFSNQSKDYGVILKVQNPADPDTHYICFAGIWGLGTAGSAYYFVNNLQSIRKEFGGSPFAIIVEVDIQHTATSARRVDALNL